MKPDLEKAAVRDEVESAETLVEDQGRIALSDEEWDLSPLNPWNWTTQAKWKNALIISITGFLSTSGSSILVPASTIIAARFDEPNKQLVTLTTAIYVLGLGVGPFLFAPLSELKGRYFAYSSSMVGFTLLNLACNFAPTLPALIVLRFITGAFGSSGPGLGVATISDLWIPKERGRPISIYAIGPLCGPFLGSVIGNYLVLIEWRRTFRFMTICVGVNTLAIILFMDETFGSVVRRRHEEAVFLAQHPSKNVIVRPWYQRMWDISDRSRLVIIRTFTRPPRVLMNPVALIFIIYYAFIYSVIYMFLVSLPLLFSQHDPPQSLFSYNWPANTAGLSYFGLGAGFLSAAAFAASMQDRIYRYCSLKYKDDGRPEYRLVVAQLGMLVFPTGLLIWGWTAQAQAHWIGPVIGSAIFAFGLMLAFNATQNWIVDSFYPYSAAAMAAATIIRSFAGCVLPIFADSLLIKLDYGLGGTVLALISMLAIPAPYFLFFHGKYLRERYPFNG